VSRAVSVGAAVLLALAALAGLVTGGPGAAVRTLLNLSLVLGLPVLWAREVRQQRELADAEHARAEQDALLDGARARGQRVELDDRRGGARLTAAADLAAHRVVQEALTNAAKHAPGRAVRVVLRRGGVGVVVEVGTDLVPGAGPGDGTGSGLVGLAERARAAGGRLAAGAEGGRWTVRAELPTAGAAADAADPAVEGAP
jgi:signal transduction histidine kinase